MNEGKASRVNRRGFLKGGTATAAAVGLAAGFGATGAQAAPPRYTRTSRPVPGIAFTFPQREGEAAEWDADVIVVGTGGSGLVAALTAADAGAKVLQFEKTDTVGGCWHVSGGSSSAAVTKIQLENGLLEDSETLFYTDCMRMGHFYSDPEILKFHVAHAGMAVDWLDSLGAYADRTPQPDIYDPPFSVNRNYNADGGGMGFLNAVSAEHQKRVDRGDIKVLMETRVLNLITEGERVIGVTAAGTDGEEIEYLAGAVVLCTGGYTNNPELVAKYNYPAAVSMAPAHCTGDGHSMLETLGAAFTDMDYLPAYLGYIEDPDNPGRPLTTVGMNKYPGAIWVGLDGKRRVDEHVGSLSNEAKNAMATAPQSTLVVVFDSQVVENEEPIVKAWGWDGFLEKAAEGVVAFSGETIEDLAAAAGLDAAGLAETVEAYNGYVEAGEDAEFGRESLEYKLEQGPFYAIKTVPGMLLSKGGPAINDKMQPKNATGKVFHGVFVAGELAGGSKVSGHGNVTGVANTICVTFGRQAGKQAADLAWALALDM